jgi:Flp pilus assembly protein TadD
MQGREAEALDHLQQAALLDPTDPVTFNTLGRLQARGGDLGAAEAQFRKAIELDPQYTDARRNLEMVLEAQGPAGEVGDQGVQTNGRASRPSGVRTSR